MFRSAADSSLELTVSVKTSDGGMWSRAIGVSKPGCGNVGQDVQQGKGSADMCTHTFVQQHLLGLHTLDQACAGAGHQPVLCWTDESS